MKRRLVLAGASAAILGLGWRRFQRLSEPDVAATDLPLHTSLQRGITKYLQVGDILFRGRDDSWGELGALISRRDQRYGHVGVMTRHNDAWAVVSATGNPLDREGHVQREPLNGSWCRAQRHAMT